MDLLFLYCFLLLAFTASVSIIFPLYTNKSNAPPSHSNLPPGKSTGLITIITESLQMLSAGKNGCPQKFVFDRVSKYSSQIFQSSILGKPMMVFSGAEANKLLFSNENKYVTVWLPDAVRKLFQFTGHVSPNEEAKRMRKLFVNYLKTDKAMQRYIGAMDTTTQRHLDAEWEGNQQVTVLPLVKRCTLSVACKVFLSMEDPKKICNLAKKVDKVTAAILSFPINFPGTTFSRGMKASKAVMMELLDIIKQRKTDVAENRASPTQDILSHMLQITHDGQYMSEEEIAQMILGLLVAGSDPTASAITFVIKFLAELPHIYNGVLQEQMEIVESKKQGELLNWGDIQKMKYSWNVICETMRITPPAQGAFRQAINDFNFAGFTIPRGWQIFWSSYSTHWNPDYFPNPEKFDPKRFEGNGPNPYTFVPFGGGPRMCSGKEYARLLILVFIHNAVKRFQWKKVLLEEKTIVAQVPMPSKGLPIHLFPQHA